MQRADLKAAFASNQERQALRGLLLLDKSTRCCECHFRAPLYLFLFLDMEKVRVCRENTYS